MACFVDIHTHGCSSHDHDIVEVVSLDVADIAFHFDEDFLCSVGIHPWSIKSDTDKASLFGIIDEYLNKDCVLAVGEAGLDRCHIDTVVEQKEMFIKEIELSECHAKPLIIHAVRSCYDIIEMRKISGAVMPWIIHGFRGSLRMAEQLLQHDVGISLGIMSLHDDNKASMLLKMIPMDKLFFETDVSTVPIKAVYEKASSLLDMDVEFLRDNIYNNFVKCFCR